VIRGGDGSKGELMKKKMSDHFGSQDGGESGISVHVVRVEWRWVCCLSTTSLAALLHADNVLKHDT
jgi:hypothetical protein